ncbi:myb-like HTH transcriptional regulator family protein [Raphanus sativus]|nr:myb-like HTH transcriptional regulator family protein [Raphanus sativus]
MEGRSLILVQRQLHLRIEAQGKYLKKIIEEQQRLSGALGEPPSSLVTGDSDPASHARHPSLHYQINSGKECGPDKSLSVDESHSSYRELLIRPGKSVSRNCF